MVATSKKHKEAAEEYYKDILFDGFYHVWKLNKPLNLSFLSEEEQDEEFANCERRAQEEAAKEAAARATIASSSTALPKVAPVIGVVEEPMVESAEAIDASIDV